MSGDDRGSMRALWLATRLAGTFSARAAGPLAARLWFTPWQMPLSKRAAAQQESWLRGTTPLELDVDGRRIAGFVAGTGPTALLVHGWGERAAGLGAFVAPLVEDGYRVVGIDLPAHGASPGRQTDLLIIEETLRSVADVLGGIHVAIGHSVGGTAVAVALSHGLEVDAAVLISPSVRLEHAVERFGPMFRLPPRALAGLRRTIERRYGADIWDRFAVDRLALSYDVPVLIVHDADDPQVGRADARLLADAWPGARLLATRGLGHVRPTRDLAVIAEIRAFLREQASEKPAGWEKASAATPS